LISAIRAVLAGGEGLDSPVAFDEGVFRGSVALTPDRSYSLVVSIRGRLSVTVGPTKSELEEIASLLEQVKR
jgi:hypothetical protein